MSNLRHWIWLSTRGTPPGLYAARILQHFGTPEGAYHADEKTYDQLDVPGKVRESLREKGMGEVDEILLACQRQGISILTIQDASYPERLRQIENPPCVLYVKGKLPLVDQEAAITIVGTRGATPYGILAAQRLGLNLARCGALVVSGSARGIDTAALKGALQGGGQVISVLGNGIDVIYPKENKALYDDVAQAGALLSEYPPGTEPLGAHFPIRNRILAGLSLGTVVVEGETGSGALITARLALEGGRDVFAVPGNIDAPMSRGPNALIRKGEAKLIQDVWDILEEYEYSYPAKLCPQGELPQRVEEARLSAIPSPGAPLVPPAAEDFWERAPQRETPRKPPKAKPAWEEEETPAEAPPKLVVDLAQEPEFFTDDEAAILRALQGEAASTADDLVEETGIPARRVLSALTLLQVRQLVTQGPGKRFTAQVILKEPTTSVSDDTIK